MAFQAENFLLAQKIMFTRFVYMRSAYGVINIKLKTPQLDFYDALQFILPMMAF